MKYPKAVKCGFCEGRGWVKEFYGHNDYDRKDCRRCHGKGEILGEVIYVMRQIEKATRLLRKKRDKVSSQHKKKADWYRNKANAMESRGLRASDKINSQIRIVTGKLLKKYPAIDMSGLYGE
jgi:hypothetical protein